MSKEAYQIEFDAFTQGFKIGQVSGEQVGEMIMRMVQYFCDQNLIYAAQEELLNSVAAQNVEMVDEATGKQVSVAKAQIMTEASPAHTSSAKAKAHLQNIEQCINALKSLQKGVMQEWTHMGGV